MSHQIDLRVIKSSINAVLDHLIEDLQQPTVEIDAKEDLYWHISAAELSEVSKPPHNLDIGSLKDDFDFVKLIRRGQAGDIAYNLVHIAPLLRYIGERVKTYLVARS